MYNWGKTVQECLYTCIEKYTRNEQVNKKRNTTKNRRKTTVTPIKSWTLIMLKKYKRVNYQHAVKCRRKIV